MNKIILTTLLSMLLFGCVSDVSDDRINLGPDESPKISARIMQLGCNITVAPGDSFAGAFSKMKPGHLLCLQDGVYFQQMDIPSNTHVRALNDGKVEINGQKVNSRWRATLTLHGNNSSVRGIKVRHAATNADTCNIAGTNNTMRIMSCSHGGKHKHKIPLKISGSGHLIEDSWFYGKGRYVVQCFKGTNITFRRNVARWDSTNLDTLSEPNATYAIYNCSNMTIENNISLDYARSFQEMRFGADFYSPQNCRVWKQGNNNNHYLGNYVINHALGNLNRKSLRFEADCTAKDNVVNDFYVRSSDYGIVISRQETGLILENCTFIDIVNRNVAGRGENLNKDCLGAAEIGAKYINRVKVSVSLFPWSNEDQIKEDMCNKDERQSDWCLTDNTLSEYVKGI